MRCQKEGGVMAGGRQRGAAHRLGRAELALAYELHCEGCSWRNISKGLGVDRKNLARAIARLTTERDKCLN